MNRKIWLVLPLLFTLVFLSQTLPPLSLAVAEPHIYIEEASIVNTSKTVGETFTVSIKTNCTDDDIWGYQFVLTYNPLVLSGTSVSNGDLINVTKHPTTYNSTGFDNNAGRLGLTGAYFYPIDNTTGTGDDTLANVTFTVTGTGDTPITLEAETKLMRDDGTNIIDAAKDLQQIGHGYFSNVDPPPVHDVAAISGAANRTAFGHYKVKKVEVNATVKNEGEVNETLAISVYWRFISADWLIYNKTTPVLDSGDTYNISFVWDPNSTIYGYGDGNITVVVDKVLLENDTNAVDNQKAIQSYHVRIKGNVNDDFIVDTADYIKLIGGYPSPPETYNEYYDLDFDLDVDSDDFVIIVGNLGKHE